LPIADLILGPWALVFGLWSWVFAMGDSRFKIQNVKNKERIGN
jgi:hypothetical protein